MNIYRTKKTVGTIILHLVVAFIGLIMLFPFIWMILGSFKYNKDVLSIPVNLLPPEWNFASYKNAFAAGPFGRYYLNSVIVLVFALVINVVTCTTSGYGLAKFKFKGRDFFFTLILSTLMIPIQTIVVPLFVLISKMKLVNTYAGIIIPLSLSGFGVFLMRQFFYSVPDELLEAARIDGAGEFYIFRKISIPISTVAIISLTIFHSQYVWKNLLWPLVVATKTNLRTLTVGISLFSGVFFTPYPEQLAMSVSACIPIVVLFIFLSKYFIRGTAMTGIKG
ncbi:MAG: carbohydrate ABC transporter permease [Sphaerochaetaceae bacterium]|nr:carbohydrate ABC transporter permease [Sphaerochaetaceae bacterium]MDX9810245.1 carbohydrate ABC transporter permease [Sphaerochaetaceae bacterium]NLV84174.1 carbohydrate ABC transporter permease [Spirochaetales bacterium]